MDNSENDSDIDYSVEEVSFSDYYNAAGQEHDIDPVTDPEYFDFECLSVEDVEDLINVTVERLSRAIEVPPSFAKLLLHSHKWAFDLIEYRYHDDSSELLVSAKIYPKKPIGSREITPPRSADLGSTDKDISLSLLSIDPNSDSSPPPGLVLPKIYEGCDENDLLLDWSAYHGPPVSSLIVSLELDLRFLFTPDKVAKKKKIKPAPVIHTERHCHTLLDTPSSSISEEKYFTTDDEDSDEFSQLMSDSEINAPIAEPEYEGDDLAMDSDEPSTSEPKPEEKEPEIEEDKKDTQEVPEDPEMSPPQPETEATAENNGNESAEPYDHSEIQRVPVPEADAYAVSTRYIRDLIRAGHRPEVLPPCFIDNPYGFQLGTRSHFYATLRFDLLPIVRVAAYYRIWGTEMPERVSPTPDEDYEAEEAMLRARFEQAAANEASDEDDADEGPLPTGSESTSNKPEKKDLKPEGKIKESRQVSTDSEISPPQSAEIGVSDEDDVDEPGPLATGSESTSEKPEEEDLKPEEEKKESRQVSTDSEISPPQSAEVGISDEDEADEPGPLPTGSENTSEKPEEEKKESRQLSTDSEISPPQSAEIGVSDEDDADELGPLPTGPEITSDKPKKEDVTAEGKKKESRQLSTDSEISPPQSAEIGVSDEDEVDEPGPLPTDSKITSDKPKEEIKKSRQVSTDSEISPPQSAEIGVSDEDDADEPGPLPTGSEIASPKLEEKDRIGEGKKKESRQLSTDSEISPPQSAEIGVSDEDEVDEPGPLPTGSESTSEKPEEEDLKREEEIKESRQVSTDSEISPPQSAEIGVSDEDEVDEPGSLPEGSEITSEKPEEEIKESRQLSTDSEISPPQSAEIGVSDEDEVDESGPLPTGSDITSPKPEKKDLTAEEEKKEFRQLSTDSEISPPQSAEVGISDEDDVYDSFYSPPDSGITSPKPEEKKISPQPTTDSPISSPKAEKKDLATEDGKKISPQLSSDSEVSPPQSEEASAEEDGSFQSAIDSDISPPISQEEDLIEKKNKSPTLSTDSEISPPQSAEIGVSDEDDSGSFKLNVDFDKIPPMPGAIDFYIEGYQKYSPELSTVSEVSPPQGTSEEGDINGSTLWSSNSESSGSEGEYSDDSYLRYYDSDDSPPPTLTQDLKEMRQALREQLFAKRNSLPLPIINFYPPIKNVPHQATDSDSDSEKTPLRLSEVDFTSGCSTYRMHTPDFRSPKVAVAALPRSFSYPMLCNKNNPFAWLRDLYWFAPPLPEIDFDENAYCFLRPYDSDLSSPELSIVGSPGPMSPSLSDSILESVIEPLICPVCVTTEDDEDFRSLPCGHQFCTSCWKQHFEIQIQLGISTNISCMFPECEVLVTEDFVLALISSTETKKKYQEYAFYDYVKTNPELRFCPGPDCPMIARAKDPKPKRVICTACKTSFCFGCGAAYHAPIDCESFKRWLIKCEDDSETAHYISAHTKVCPECHVVIEKNGGCNHMKCFKCKKDFCWVCLDDWKSHGNEYYKCSRYQQDPDIEGESSAAAAKIALDKYLHYYTRWQNHSKSLKLEEELLQIIKLRIESKIMESSGTWIDWQFMYGAAALLTKCRYTLQYTYPYAYFMEEGTLKNMFEDEQAVLEAEIENLSWKVENAETTDIADLAHQMDIVEKRRLSLLRGFLKV